MSARPRHPAQDERIVEGFKKLPRALKAHLEGLPETTPIEIWFQDEARIGQKNPGQRTPQKSLIGVLGESSRTIGSIPIC